MRTLSATLSAAGLLLAHLPAVAAVRPHHHTSTHALVRHNEAVHSHHSAGTEHSAIASMSTDRATEIQQALIKRGYLSGEPTGSWDSASFSAMQKLQGDNGWQTKLVPDSRALIKLGLGPGTTPASSTEAAPTAAVQSPAVPPHP